MTTLTARTAWLDEPVDLLSVAGADGWLWERDQAGLAGCGAALTIQLPDGLCGAADVVSAVLGSISTTDMVGEPACGPIAVGALPFDRRRPAELTVPSIVVGRTVSGACWVTTVGTATFDPGQVLEPLPPQDPDGFTLTSPIAHSRWMDLVAQAVAAISMGDLQKVVLAREIQVDANREIHVPTVLRRLRSLYPACTILSASDAASGGRFVAASPELLLSRLGDQVRSHPLAGTIPRSGNPETDQALAARLLASPKDRAEHDLVVRDVETALAPWCAALDVPDAPSIVSLRNVSHLGTLVSGTLRSPGPSALALATALHPTAAVGGTPRDSALAWLATNEGMDRGPYAGPVGWVDAKGDGEWAVGIRSAVVTGSRARLFAGVGVVEGSDPAAELAETQFKLQALLAAVVRP